MATKSRIVPMMFLSAAAATLAAGGATGCATQDSPSSADRALNDPYNYGSNPNNEWPDVSGGGIHQFDKKGFKQDLNNVLNP